MYMCVCVYIYIYIYTVYIYIYIYIYIYTPRLFELGNFASQDSDIFPHSFCADSSSPLISAIRVGPSTLNEDSLRNSRQFPTKLSQQLRREISTSRLAKLPSPLCICICTSARHPHRHLHQPLYLHPHQLMYPHLLSVAASASVPAPAPASASASVSVSGVPPYFHGPTNTDRTYNNCPRDVERK